MLSRTELADRHGLTERQVRRKLEALGPLIARHTATGDRGKELYDDHAITLFDQLLQLEQQGLSTQAAAERITQETIELAGQAGASNGHPDLNTPSSELVEALKAQLSYAREEIEFLRTQVEKKDKTLEAILPMLPGQAEGAGTEQADRQPARNLTRWQHLKAALVGQ